MTARVGNAGENRMAHEYQIHLNFLAIGENFPNFIVHRKLRAHHRLTTRAKSCTRG